MGGKHDKYDSATFTKHSIVDDKVLVCDLKCNEVLVVKMKLN